MNEQLGLCLDVDPPRTPTVAEAVARGWLRLVIDAERPIDRLGAFVGDRAFVASEAVRIVHVISTGARGEIRGYVLVRGRLHLRLPCYSGAWPELDAWVSEQLSAPVVPYSIGPGGMEAESDGGRS